MTNAIRSDAALSMAVAGLLLFAPLATAQQSVIDHCRNTSSDADRIACLEAALLGRASSAIPADTTRSQIDPPSMEIEAGPDDEGNGINLAVAAAPPASQTGEVSAEPGPGPEVEPAGIGAEQVIARNQTIEERDESLEQATGLVISNYHWVPYERLVVTFENGQVWRQIKGDKNRIRTSLERNQTADIAESGVGGYKLRLNEIRRTIRVERIR